MSAIVSVAAREILDSRGTPTIEVDIRTQAGGFGRAAVPSGASTGRFEAKELRDGDPSRYGGKGTANAVRRVHESIAPAIRGLDALDQSALDTLLIDLDGTPDKSQLGANSILAVSLAVSKAAAAELEIPLFRYIGGAQAHLLPTPFMNVLNGGAHADNSLDMQEFMIVPVGAASFAHALQMGARVYEALKQVLVSRGLSTGVGDEGGFAPNLESNEAALQLLVEATEQAGYEPGQEIAIALDVAATELYKDASYTLSSEGRSMDAGALVDMLAAWIDTYPIISIEDPVAEDDWDGWKMITDSLGKRCQLVGDDLFVTNAARIVDGVARGAANAVLIKVNQVGTLSESAEAVAISHRAAYATMVSHRSGETEDTTIADLAVAFGSGQIKAGAPARSERVAKYNQLLRIEESLGEAARYAGPAYLAQKRMIN